MRYICIDLMEFPIVWRTMEHGLVQHQDHCPKMINEKDIVIDNL